MPELPEVETVVRDLRPLLTGRTIRAVRQSKRKLRRPWNADWSAAAVGLRVEGLRRRGKWILVDLSGRAGGVSPLLNGNKDKQGADTPRSPEPLLRVHLGMTGQF